jgi:hypothetical protein
MTISIGSTSFTGEFARVRLVDPEKVYRFLVRAPAGVTAATANQTILAAVPEILVDPFFRHIEQEAITAWRGNKSFLGLSVGGIDTFLTIASQICRAAISITGPFLAGP